MKKTFFILMFLLVALCGYSQYSMDSCIKAPPAIKAYIPGADSLSVKISDLKNGFRLAINVPNLKVIHFCASYNDELVKSGFMFYYVHYTSDSFYLDKYQPFKEHIDGAKKFFIDWIIAQRGEDRFCIRPIVYDVKQ
jgi:hypothetical protein